MITKSKRTILKHQLEDALKAISDSGMGLIIESDTILLVLRAEVVKQQNKTIDPELNNPPLGPVEVLKDLQVADWINDSGALLGTGAS